MACLDGHAHATDEEDEVTPETALIIMPSSQIESRFLSWAIAISPACYANGPDPPKAVCLHFPIALQTSQHSVNAGSRIGRRCGHLAMLPTNAVNN